MKCSPTMPWLRNDSSRIRSNIKHMTTNCVYSATNYGFCRYCRRCGWACSFRATASKCKGVTPSLVSGETVVGCLLSQNCASQSRNFGTRVGLYVEASLIAKSHSKSDSKSRSFSFQYIPFTNRREKNWEGGHFSPG